MKYLSHFWKKIFRQLLKKSPNLFTRKSIVQLIVWTDQKQVECVVREPREEEYEGDDDNQDVGAATTSEI